MYFEAMIAGMGNFSTAADIGVDEDANSPATTVFNVSSLRRD